MVKEKGMKVVCAFMSLGRWELDGMLGTEMPM